MTAPERKYLGVPAPKPRVGFFELTSCEGCQLQLLNNEATLLDFLDLVEITTFREIMSGPERKYDVAFVEGSVSCEEEVARLKSIRNRAEKLVAFGSCACFGGVNQLRNRNGSDDWARQRVYGTDQLPVTPLPAVLPLEAVVQVDVEIFGCPVAKEEVERIVCDLVIGRKIRHPRYPVCMECTAQGIICLYELEQICLGPVSRGGCNAWCPSGGTPCNGCRGPAPAANIEQLYNIVGQRGLPQKEFLEKLELFGGFQSWIEGFRQDDTPEKKS